MSSTGSSIVLPVENNEKLLLTESDYIPTPVEKTVLQSMIDFPYVDADSIARILSDKQKNTSSACRMLFQDEPICQGNHCINVNVPVSLAELDRLPGTRPMVQYSCLDRVKHEYLFNQL